MRFHIFTSYFLHHLSSISLLNTSHTAVKALKKNCHSVNSRFDTYFLTGVFRSKCVFRCVGERGHDVLRRVVLLLQVYEAVWRGVRMNEAGGREPGERGCAV